MLSSYIRIAFRYLKKNRAFSIINITGLALGTLCCLYILLYIGGQYSYDRHHHHAEDIYRVNTSVKIPGDQHHSATSSPPVAPAMKNDFSEVLQFTRVVPTIGVKQHLLRYRGQSFYEKEAVFADSTFFDVFTYHFLAGNPANALREPYTIVLSAPVARKLFGNADPLGQIINIDNAYGRHDFRVTGVVDESLGSSHLQANMFFTMNSGGLGQMVRENDVWAGNNFTWSYVKLAPHVTAAALEKKLPAFLEKYGGEQLKKRNMEKQLHLQPVTSIHTTPGLENEAGKTVSPSFLYMLLLIAVLIQVIACINFMNLSTARASRRAKEVGVRKAVGAGRSDLVKQFLGESVLLALAGVLIALPLLVMVLPYLNRITEANISIALLHDYRLLLALTALVLVTGVIAGSYPAFYLSAFRVVKVMKGNFTSHIAAGGLRRSLVVFQFVISIVLITGIIVIYSQLGYIRHRDLGFEKEQQLVFTFHTSDARSKMMAFMEDLRRLPEVKAVSKTNNYPSRFVFNDLAVFLAGGDISASRSVQFMRTDQYFAKAMGIRLLNGRDFHLHDEGRVLVNETMARQLGLDPAAITGVKLYTQGKQTYEVAGVMKDFNYSSLREDVRPFMLMYDPDNEDLSNVVVNTSSRNYSALLPKMEAVWRSHLPGVPFEYRFLDDEVQQQYETEITLSRIVNSFTIMAIFISCLGLFGLAAFSAEQRTREISIRKVLGANVLDITTLLSGDFIKLLVIAIVIAVPISWWAMSRWLQTFAYRVNISWWMFAAAGVAALVIALATVSYQTLKAATANPVKGLKTE